MCLDILLFSATKMHLEVPIKHVPCEMCLDIFHTADIYGHIQMHFGGKKTDRQNDKQNTCTVSFHTVLYVNASFKNTFV